MKKLTNVVKLAREDVETCKRRDPVVTQMDALRRQIAQLRRQLDVSENEGEAK